VITLGVDVGTTRTKVLALDVESGDTLALESAPTPTQRDTDGESHRPAVVLDVTKTLLARVVDELPDRDRVAALSVASVGEEVVLIDADGQALGDAIAWYDPRGLEEARAFMAGEGGEVALTKRWPPDQTYSLFKLQWSRDHQPDLYAAAASWTDLGDYVLHGLGAELVMDWSHASRAGAFDISTHRWDAETVGAADLAIEFPRLVPSGTVIGTVAQAASSAIGIGLGVPIVSGGHDHLCAAFGAGLRSTGELFLSAGTSEAHLALLSAPLEGESGRGIDQGCYVDDHTYYAHVNTHSGHFFQQWRSLLFADADDVQMYAEAESATSGAITFDVADDLRQGRFDHVPYDAARGQLMRAILEGLARRSSSIVKRLERASGGPYELVLIAGHPTRVPLWRALREDAYRRNVAAVDEPETAAYGAAVIAARAVGAPGAEQLVARRTAWT
jgi:xylulokinase